MQSDSFPEVGRLNIAFFHSPLVTLGPGRRVGLWLRGCFRSCPGCIAPELWAEEPSDRREVEAVAEEILRRSRDDACRGLTVSGGEPFAQAAALGALIDKVTPVLPDILVYSGHKHEELEREYPWIRKIACLIDGPFDRTQPCPDAWKGSANQTMIVYAEQFSDAYETWKGEHKGRLQIVPALGRILGIPRIDSVQTD